MRPFLKYWVPLYAYAGLIFYLSSIPRPLPEIRIPFFDKALHIFEYAIFGFIAARAFRNSSRAVFCRHFKIFAVIISFLYGISDEYHQGFVSQRQFSVFDMLADGVGGFLGAHLYGGNYPFQRHAL